MIFVFRRCLTEMVGRVERSKRAKLTELTSSFLLSLRSHTHRPSRRSHPSLPGASQASPFDRNGHKDRLDDGNHDDSRFVLLPSSSLPSTRPKQTLFSLLALRFTAKYHKELSKLVNDVTIDAPTILLLDQANKEVHEWHRKWNEFSGESIRPGIFP